MADEEKEMEDTPMNWNNQTEFDSPVAAHRAAYAGYDQQEAKKEAETIWTKIKDDYTMCLVCSLQIVSIIRDTYLFVYFLFVFSFVFNTEPGRFYCELDIIKFNLKSN